MQSPVQFINVINGELHFDRHSFEKMISVISHRPQSKLIVITVCGALRTGKSTLLNAFCRHGDLTTPFITGYGTASITRGMWGFILPQPINNDTYLMLVDTQGIFDSSLDQRLTTTLFGLSTLISSVQIYNIEKRIQEDHLQNLEMFGEYAKVVTETNWKPFQNLSILVRDWQHYDVPNNLSRCYQQSKEYIDSIWSNVSTKQAISTRQRVGRCYQNISCYCLPHPGFEFAENGTLQVRQVFKDHLKCYVSHIISSAQPKIAFDTYIRVINFANYIEQSLIALTQHQGLPEPTSILEATINTKWMELCHNIIETYRYNMSKHQSSIKELESAHQRLLISIDQDIMNRFRLDSSYHKSRRLIELMNAIEEIYQTMVSEYNKRHQWDIFVYILLLGILALIFSHLSIMLCSFDICILLSKLAYGWFWITIAIITGRAGIIMGIIKPSRWMGYLRSKMPLWKKID